jgi:hypothetical protein
MPRWKERLGGIFFALVGGGMTAWAWHDLLYGSAFSQKAAAAGPAFCFLGLALIVIPGYRTERLARGEDISQLSGTELLTPRWWAVLVIGIVLGFGNLFLMYHVAGLNRW